MGPWAEPCRGDAGWRREGKSEWKRNFTKEKPAARTVPATADAPRRASVPSGASTGTGGARYCFSWNVLKVLVVS